MAIVIGWILVVVAAGFLLNAAANDNPEHLLVGLVVVIVGAILLAIGYY